MIGQVRAQREDGMTLVELLVGMSIMTVVVAAAYSLLFSVQNGVERQIDRQSSVDQARLGVEQIDRELRSAQYMTETSAGGTGMGLRVYTLANETTRGAMCEEWRKNGDELQSRYWPVSFAVGSTYPWRTVATGIQNAAGEDIFDIDSSAAYGGRLLHVDLRVNTNPGSVTNSNVQIKTDLTARNVSGGTNPCDASQPG